MTDRPILFSAPMVRALLDDRKSQTRRVLKFGSEPPVWTGDGIATSDPSQWAIRYYDKGSDSVDVRRLSDVPRYRPGDRLYVREHWQVDALFDDDAPRHIERYTPITYRADGVTKFGELYPGRIRQAIHMPRWASRITLHVTEVRVERLQDINEEDALAEGVVKLGPGDFRVPGAKHPNPDFPYLSRPTAREMYAALWDVINGSGAWCANPWVVTTSFIVAPSNIDSARSAVQ